MVPEKDLQKETPETTAAPLVSSSTKEDEITDERLSVFEDFLEKLDLDKGSEEDDEEKDQ